MVAHVPALKTPRLQVLLLLHPHRHQALLHQLHHLPILFMETIAGLAGGMLNLLVELSVLMEIQLSAAMANIVLLIFLVLTPPSPSPPSPSPPSPTPPTDDCFCGNGVIGNGKCEDSSLCCSTSGYCGNTCGGGTCGYGYRGNGVCADSSLCCSEYGWCDNTPEHCKCPASPPSPSPPSPTPPTNFSPSHDDSRLIAYVGNWQTCPTLEETDPYTHIVIAFAVTYTWNPTKNQCSSTCNIGSPVPICNNQNNQALVDAWKAAGKKVILSFGGAGKFVDT